MKFTDVRRTSHGHPAKGCHCVKDDRVIVMTGTANAHWHCSLLGSVSNASRGFSHDILVRG